jgi:uncharacterized protein YbjT (DUF2867 family)
MILITGAGGKTGKSLIKVLSNVESVLAFVHRAEQLPVAKSLGAQKIIVGDLRDGSAIRAAVQGVRAVYHVCPNMSPDEVVIGKLVIEEARNAGTEHLVYHSVLHPQTEKMAHHSQKLRVEEMIFESGLPFTILQPAPYMQNLLANWKSIVEEGVLRVPDSIDSKFSFIDLEDIAEVAKIVLTEPGHFNAIYELAGTLPMSHVEVSEIIGNVLKRVVRAEKEETSDWQRRTSTALARNARSAQREEYALENLVKMFDYYDRWGLGGNPNVLRWILKREPTSFQSFVRRTLKEHNTIH